VLKILLSAFLLLTATVAGWRVHQRDQLERRARRAVNTLRYVVDVDHDNLEIVSAIHYPGRGVCVEYKDRDNSGAPYISRAVLVDGEDRVSSTVDINDDLWTTNCGDVYSRNLIDLTDVAK
jgi:hypothetical protein